MAMSAQQGQNVYKEPTVLQEWGVGSEGGQLQFLKEGEQRKVKETETQGLPELAAVPSTNSLVCSKSQMVMCLF